MPGGTALSLAAVLAPNPLAGNLLARRLRFICEDSSGIFPEEPASSPGNSYERECLVRLSAAPAEGGGPQRRSFSSTSTPAGRASVREQRPGSCGAELGAMKPASAANHSAVIVGSPRDEKAFMQWKMPRSISGDPAPEREVQSARSVPCELPPMSPGKKSATPRLPSLNGAAAPGHRPASRRPTLAVNGAPGSPAARPLGSSRASLRSQRCGRGAETAVSGFKPLVAPRAADLLKDANPTERRVIEKALLLAEHSAITDSLRRSLLPEAEAQVRKWLETASPEEREVALNFFHNVAGNKLMSTANREKHDRLFKVLKALESGDNAFVSQSHPHFTVGDGSSSLRHLRLLTPNTRRNRWMHTTWHHLPPYQDTDPVDNRSSHYSLPHRPIPRHFVIHPDW